MQLPINEKTKVDNIEDPVVTRLRMEEINIQIKFLYEKCVLRDEFNQRNSNIKSEIDKCKQEEYKVL